MEEGRLLFYTVDDECPAEDFVAAVFGIDLGETEYFGVGQFTSKVLFYFLEVVHLFFRECQTFFFVVSFQIFDMDDRFRLTVGGEYFLIQSLVHALQHRVAVSVFVLYGEILFDA